MSDNWTPKQEVVALRAETRLIRASRLAAMSRVKDLLDEIDRLETEAKVLRRALEKTVPRVPGPYYMTTSERIAEARAELAMEATDE